MRTGAIFARGSCRALKWMALFGVVFALGAGSAAAQATEVELSIKSVKIGAATGAAATVRENTVVDVEVTLSAKVPDAHDDADEASPNATEVDLSLTVGDSTDTTVPTITDVGTFIKGMAETGDVQIDGNDLTDAGLTDNFRTWEEGEDKVTFRIELDHDPDAVDEKFTLTFDLIGLEEANTGSITEGQSVVTLKADAEVVRTVTITDDETQTYELDATDAAANIKEGTPFNVELEANPGRPNEEGVELHVFLDNDEYDLVADAAATGRDGRTFTFDETTADDTHEFEIDLKEGTSDGNRDNDTIMVSASMVDPNDIRKITDAADPIAIVVKDIHALPAADKITAEAFLDDDGEKDEDEETTSVTEGGDPVHVTITVDRGEDGYPSGEVLEVTLMAADPTQGLDYRLSDTEVEIADGTDEQTADVMLWALPDEDVGEETLTFNLVTKGADEDDNGAGESIGTFSIMIEDATTPLVEVREGAYEAIMTAMGADPLNPDDSFSIMTADLFTSRDTVSVAYGTTVEGAAASASADDQMVSVMAVSPGEAKITVTATATPMADSFIPNQTVSNVAQITFPVNVVLKDLTVDVMVDPLAIMEGETSMITATASRMVDASDGEVKVGLAIVGDATLDADGTAVGGIVIQVGETVGYTVLTATEDDDDYENEMVTVIASGTGIDGSSQYEIAVTDNDEAPVDVPTVKAKSPEDQQAAFDDAVGTGLVAGGDSVTLNTDALFEEWGEGVDLAYAVVSTDDQVVGVDVDQASGILTLTPAGAGSATISVTVTDRASGDSDTASGSVMVRLSALTVYVTAVPDEIMEGGESEITATASRMIDASDGMVKVNLSVVGDAMVEADSIEIAVGQMARSVTLTATEDDDDYEDETVTVIASGTGIDGNMPVMIMVTDNDTAPEPPVVEPTVTANADAAQMILDAVATAAGSGDWMVGGMVATVDMSMLFTAAEGASIAYSGSSSMDAVMAGASGTMLTLTPMAEGVSTITVTASDSASMDVARVDADVAVALQTLSITVTASPDTVMEGMSVTLTAAANRPVSADTMLTVTVTGDTAAVEADGMITIPMAGTSGTGMVMAVEDDDSADAMVSVVVSGAGISGGAASFDIAITDNDRTVNAKDPDVVTALFMAAVAMASGSDGWVPDGDAAELDMSTLFTTLGDPTLTYEAMSSSDMVGVSMTGSMLTLTPMETGGASITVTATDTSGDADDTASVSAMVTVGVLPLEVMVSPTSADLTEGETVDITATANKMVDANVEVMLIRDGASTAGDDDYSLMPVMITIMAGDVSGMATLTATDDDDVEGNESLRLTGTVGGMSAGMVMITIEDNDVETTYSLQASADMVEEGGAAVTITATANQMVRGNTEVMVMRDGSSQAGADDYSLEPALITIMDGAMSGTAMLTATDDYDVEGNESLTLNGMVGDMNAGSVMVTVVDNDVETTYTLSGPMDPNVAEGMSAELTVMASQMVRMDTTVMIMRDASSTGGDADFTAAAVTIMAGTDTGTTMVMAVEDNMMEDMEMLTLYGMVGDMRTNSVTLNLWDAAVPALPLIAQLLLAAFLAIGGYRRYLRR